MQFANSPFAFAESVKTERSPVSLWTAAGAHVVVLLALFALATQKKTIFPHVGLVAPTLEAPTLTPPLARTSTDGGSAGARDTAAAGLGHPPRVDDVHLAPPMIQPIVPAQLTVAPTVDVQMASNSLP